MLTPPLSAATFQPHPIISSSPNTSTALIMSARPSIPAPPPVELFHPSLQAVAYSRRSRLSFTRSYDETLPPHSAKNVGFWMTSLLPFMMEAARSPDMVSRDVDRIGYGIWFGLWASCSPGHSSLCVFYRCCYLLLSLLGQQQHLHRDR